MVGTLAGLLAQALLYGPTPVDEAVARVESLPDGARARPAASRCRSTRASPGCSRCAATSTRRAACSATRLRRPRSSACASAARRSRSSARRSSYSPGTSPPPTGSCARPPRAFDEIGAATSATTHRALLGEVVSRLGRLEEAESLAQQVAAEASPDDLIAHVLWRCTLARVRAREGSAREAVELAAEARRLLADAEFPQLAITRAHSRRRGSCGGGRRRRGRAAARRGARDRRGEGRPGDLAQLDAVRVAG